MELGLGIGIERILKMVIKDIAEIMEPSGTNISLSQGWYEIERSRQIEKDRELDS